MELYFPHKEEGAKVLSRTTHMTIAAHEDDVELTSLAVIGECRTNKDAFFTAAVVTDGASSPRSGRFAGVTDTEMVALRAEEQKRAADVGHYHALALLGYSSTDVKTARTEEVEEELAKLIVACAPTKLYTHNPADAHDTHVAVLCRVVGALRRLPPEKRPKELWGCEVWRSLDWLASENKTVVDSEAGSRIATEILNVFESQIAGGKSYDSAFLGRQCANATFSESHACDTHQHASVMLDMSALLRDDSLTVSAYIASVIAAFQNDVLQRIKKASNE